METVAHAFLIGWISRFGIPSVITTNRDVQFEYALWQNLMNFLGTKRIRTTAYHSCANGLVKCFHWQMKAALKPMSDPNQWVKSLPLVLLGIRTNVKQDINCTSAELVYGTTLFSLVSFSSAVINKRWILFRMLTNSSQLCSNFSFQL